MIYAFIRATLGPLGVAVLDFYIANSIWINGLILLYALLVVLARHTFERSCQSLIRVLQSQYGQQFEQGKQKSILKTLKKISIPWDQAVGSSSFPFMASPGSIRIYPKNASTFQRLLPLEKLAELLSANP
ncbi:MAG TPA: hypothetical protein VK206_14415 [Anaerolineales bacterium]|nr:hypothetical protein [Anaerolineales bacterium]